jgi:arylsulfatase A-like enzyme
MDRYDGEIAHVDRAFGRLLREARSPPAGKPIVVVLTADHGEEFRDHGGVYHGSTLVRGADPGAARGARARLRTIGASARRWSSWTWRPPSSA